LLTES